MKLTETIRKNKLRCGCIVLVILLCILVVCSGLFAYLYKASQIDNIYYTSTIEPDVSAPMTDVFTTEVLVNTTENYDLKGATLASESTLPKFITLKDGQLVIQPKKWDNGEYYIKLSGKAVSSVLGVKVKNSDVDFEAIKQDLEKYLADRNLTDNYGIYLKDIVRDQTIDINGTTIFPPASMAKLTMAVLILRDIDAGKYTLDTTYPLQADVIFNPDDDLAKLGVGTQVPIHTYLEKLIEDSNNTAWYHMDKFLGGSYEVVNPRTVNELGVNPLFLNPHMGTANGLGKLLDDVYNARTVSKKSRDYLINLMENALDWNRQGIGLGLPPDVEFANKIGNLWTDNDINYCDSAIVFAKNTDYILIIMDKDIDWESGKENLKEMSQIVYNYLDK